MLKQAIVPIALAALVLSAVPAAAARHARERGDPRVVALAYDLQQATHHMVRHAERRDRFHGWAHWRALRAVRQLDAQARRFQEHAERYGPHHPRTQREFVQLQRALRVVQARSEAGHHARWLRAELGGVERIANRLDTRLAALAEREREHHHHRAKHERSQHDDHERGDSYAHIVWSFRY